MSKKEKKTFTVPVYGYVTVEAQLRGVMSVQATSLEEAQKIASKVNGINIDNLPKGCELNEAELEWDDSVENFSEYVNYKRDRREIDKLRVNDDDLEDIQEED